jgi:hypothetical protein
MAAEAVDSPKVYNTASLSSKYFYISRAAFTASSVSGLAIVFCMLDDVTFTDTPQISIFVARLLDFDRRITIPKHIYFSCTKFGCAGTSSPHGMVPWQYIMLRG